MTTAKIEETISLFTEMLNHDDPIILARVQIEVLLEVLRNSVYQAQSMNDKLAVIERNMVSMDWKLWEFMKLYAPKAANATRQPLVGGIDDSEVE